MKSLLHLHWNPCPSTLHSPLLPHGSRTHGFSSHSTTFPLCATSGSRFSSDSAAGGAGANGVIGGLTFGSAGGLGQGGAVFLDADLAADECEPVGEVPQRH